MSSKNLVKIIRKIDLSHWNIDQKWIKYLPEINEKINQQSIQNVKNLPKMDLEAVLGRLGNHFGLGWPLGEAPGRILRDLGGLLGRLEAKLRAKVAPSWDPRGSFWVPRGKLWGSKNETQMDALSGASWGRYFHEFWWIFGRQNGAKFVSNWSSINREHGKGCF